MANLQTHQSLPAQCEVALGAADSLQSDPDAGGYGVFTCEALAEALTFAQDSVRPADRIPVPVSTKSAGQFVGMLRQRGLVEQVRPGGKRRPTLWRLTEAGAL